MHIRIQTQLIAKKINHLVHMDDIKLIAKNEKKTWVCVCPRDVMVKAMDCGIVVSEFVLQSRYYVHFRTNTLGEGMNPLILPAMG